MTRDVNVPAVAYGPMRTDSIARLPPPTEKSEKATNSWPEMDWV